MLQLEYVIGIHSEHLNEFPAVELATLLSPKLSHYDLGDPTSSKNIAKTPKSISECIVYNQKHLIKSGELKGAKFCCKIESMQDLGVKSNENLIS